MSAREILKKMLARLLRGRAVNKWRRRPFRVTDLRPVPEGYRVGPPDFVGVASVRSGTTWWYRLLLEHPSVMPNRLAEKELSFFYHFNYGGIDARAIETYRQAFASPSGCISGEWSPAYFRYPLAIDYLAEAAPHARLLAIVRNPIDRLLSALNQQLHQPVRSLGLKGHRAYAFRTFSLFQVVMFQSLYFNAFRRLLERFGQSQLLLLQFERCKMDPDSEIARTYRFLGIDDSFVPRALQAKVNALDYVLPKLKPVEREMLMQYFRNDVHSLARLFPEIDLSLWPDFAN